MALVTIAAVQTDVEALYAVLAERKTVGSARDGVASLNELISALNGAYTPQVTIVATDGSSMGADDAAFILIAGGLGQALNRAGVAGDVFVLSNTADTTDNMLVAAKSGAIVAGDIFAVAAGAATVTFLGNTGTPIQTDTEDRDTFMDV